MCSPGPIIVRECQTGFPTVNTQTLSEPAAAAPLTPPRTEVDAPRLPASPGQRQLWFLDQMEPGSPRYNIPYLLRLSGRLDEQALERALATIVQRHEALRTTFRTIDSEPVQVINPAATLDLTIVDLTAVPASQREAELRQCAQEVAKKPFDLRRDLMLRARLFKLAATEHALMLVMHHIASDGWSMAILCREFGACYEAFAHGKVPKLPDLPIQYADFSEWQREHLQGEVLQKLVAWWKKQMAGAPPLLELPTDFPRPPTQSHRGDIVVTTFPPGLVKQLHELSTQNRVSFFMTLLAGFQTVLFRYTGQTDLVIGSPLAGRGAPEIDGTIGFFVNMIVMRTNLSGDPTVVELLQRVRDVTLSALDHRELPYEKLIEELQPPRNLSFDPVCQCFFVQHMPLPPLALDGVRVSIAHVYTGTAKYELSAWGIEQPDGALEVTAEFALDLFRGESIQRLLGHFQTVLAGMVANPAARISQLPLLTPAERQRMLVEWNATGSDFPPAKWVHELFAEQVARTPAATALVFDDRELTYAELDAHADALAAQLREHGVGPEVLVGVCLERSLEMMIALLAILKAGGAYVPLDPSYPKERLGFMLQDSQAPVLLTKASLRPKLPPCSAAMIYLNDIGSADVSTASDERGRNATPGIEVHDAGVPPAPDERGRGSRAPTCDDLAYVLYTPGSTGNPNGVMVTHRNVVNFFTGMDQVLGPEPGVWLALTSISSDLSVLELVWPLTRGFKVVILSGAAKLSGSGGRGPEVPAPVSFIDQMRRQGVTHLQCTPSFARMVVQSPATLAAVRSLRKLLIGGEPLPVALAPQLRREVTGGIINLYGPTETTICSTTHRVTSETGATDIVPIGRPLAHQTVYVLDANRQPVPIGVPGELWIGGEGVTRGYWRRPELTAERFLANPFAGAPSGCAQTDGRSEISPLPPAPRLYRTGDLARFREDGAIEVLGRSDRQVKFRGHRVEPDEIEAALMQHSEVRQAVVVLRADDPDDPQLVAYFVAAGDQPPAPDALRDFLRQKLPAPMVPALYVALEKMPLTPNGGVDSKALPAPHCARVGPKQEFVAPQAGVEQTLAAIWQDILRVERIGVDDNFFDAGGHSMQVVQLQDRLRETLGLDVPLLQFFQFPTIRSLAKSIGGRPPSGPDGGEGHDSFRAGIDERTRLRRNAIVRRRAAVLENS